MSVVRSIRYTEVFRQAEEQDVIIFFLDESTEKTERKSPSMIPRFPENCHASPFYSYYDPGYFARPTRIQVVIMRTRKRTLGILLSLQLLLLPLFLETAHAQNLFRWFHTMIDPCVGSASYMLIYLFRGGRQPLTESSLAESSLAESYIGRQDLSIYGYRITSTFFPKGHESSIAPPPQRS